MNEPSTKKKSNAVTFDGLGKNLASQISTNFFQVENHRIAVDAAAGTNDAAIRRADDATTTRAKDAVAGGANDASNRLLFRKPLGQTSLAVICQMVVQVVWMMHLGDVIAKIIVRYTVHSANARRAFQR